MTTPTPTPDPTGSGEAIVYADLGVTVYHGNCLDVLRTMPDASVDSIVTDPPYGLGFMGKGWDALPPGEDWARECLRVLKPGGHLLAFGGSRTWHRLMVAVEDAGFEIRDSIAWLYGSGFPKSLDVSKAIDKAAGAERPVIGVNPRAAQQTAKSDATALGTFKGTSSTLTAPATPAAQQWAGWGTALKPAFEPIVVARKPLAGTVAANVLAHGTGALNIDACRVPATDKAAFPVGYVRGAGTTYAQDVHTESMASSSSTDAHPSGRWPTNVVLDGTTADALDEQSGSRRSRAGQPRSAAKGDGWRMTATGAEYNEEGGASRFFPVFRYQAKAPARERPSYTTADGRKVAHSTVKPVEIMRWLVRLVTPPGGRVLDPFGGTGTTGEAAVLEGFEAILVEREADYIPLIQIRLDALDASRAAEPPAAVETPGLFDLPTEEAS